MNKLPGLVIWFTGLSGSGKTTIAKGVMDLLIKKDIKTIIFDGDDIRDSKHSNLGFSEEDIKLNNSLIVKLCKKNQLFFNVILVPIISPYKESRAKARKNLSKTFHEIYFSASIDCVKKRDVKGLYAKAQNKEITNLIGVAPNNPYEKPENPNFIIDTENQLINQSINLLYNYIILQL